VDTKGKKRGKRGKKKGQKEFGWPKRSTPPGVDDLYREGFMAGGRLRLEFQKRVTFLKGRVDGAHQKDVGGEVRRNNNFPAGKE